MAEDGTREGLRFLEIPESLFEPFARRHGTSAEIGRIGTFLDEDGGADAAGEPRLFGLFGCTKLCATVTCTIRENADGRGHACKLDSVIVAAELRKRGLAKALVAKAFIELMGDPELEISRLFSYAVHPATVTMLTGLSFSEPPILGAPICAIKIDDAGRGEFLLSLEKMLRNATDPLKLRCALCLKDFRRARPWCGAKFSG